MGQKVDKRLPATVCCVCRVCCVLVGCDGDLTCLTYSKRIPDHECYNDFNDYSCDSDYNMAWGKCAKSPVASPVKAPELSPVKSPTYSCPSGKKCVEGYCVLDGCNNNGTRPTSSKCIPNRECYDDFKDCTCDSNDRTPHHCRHS